MNKYYCVISAAGKQILYVVDADVFPIFLSNASALCYLMPEFCAVQFEYAAAAVFYVAAEYVDPVDKLPLNELLSCDNGWQPVTAEVEAWMEAIPATFAVPTARKLICGSGTEWWVEAVTTAGELYSTKGACVEEP
jgi:hypothetical protein